jgi:hypothetical protein
MATFDQNQATMLQIQQLLQQLVPLIQQQSSMGNQQQAGPNYFGQRNNLGGTSANPLNLNKSGQDPYMSDRNPELQKLMDLLGGQNQEFGFHPHLSALENILSRLSGPNNEYANAFNGKQASNPLGMLGNNYSSSFMNAQDKANQPLSWGQRAGQFTGGALQDLTPIATAAGGLAGGPLGAGIAGGTSNLLGRGISYLSQPYQIPQGY